MVFFQINRARSIDFIYLLLGLFHLSRQTVVLGVEPTCRSTECYDDEAFEEDDDDIELDLYKSAHDYGSGDDDDDAPSASSLLSTNEKRKPLTTDLYYDVIFRKMEEIQYKKIDRPFGRMLDSGTGKESLRFINFLMGVDHDYGVTDYTAITADSRMFEEVRQLASKMQMPVAPQQHAEGAGCSGIVIGNWAEDAFCEDDRFDSMMLDYLVGSMDAFAPYLQYDIIDRLARHLEPGGTMHIIGMEPLEDKGTDPKEFISRMRQIRDATILFAGKRYYREYPLSWMIEEVKSSNLVIKDIVKFGINYSKKKILGQLKVAKDYLDYIPHQPLADEIATVIHDMEHELDLEYGNSTTHVITSSFDYLIVAQKPL